MSAIDAILGKLANNGVELELRGTLNFDGFTFAPFNDADGNPAGWTITPPPGGVDADASFILGVPIATLDSGVDGDALVQGEGEMQWRHMTEMTSIPTAAKLPKFVSGGLPAKVTNATTSEDSAGKLAARATIVGTYDMTPTAPTLGSFDTSTAPDGAILSVCTSTSGQRGFQIYQFNTGAQSARINAYKAEGTRESPVAVTADGHGILRSGGFAWDGTNWVDVGFVDFETASRFNSNHNGGFVTAATPAVRCLIKSEGPVFAANNSGSSVLQTPVAHTWYFAGTTTNNTPVTALSGVTIDTPVLSDTSTIYGYHLLAIDQTNGERWHQVGQIGVMRIGAADPVLYATVPTPVDFVKDDAAWALTRAINSGTKSVRWTFTGDTTHNVKLTLYVYELAVQAPTGAL
jgi:hypothetical protein